LGECAGYNAWPIADDRCCHICDELVVFPARLAGIQEPSQSKAWLKRRLAQLRRVGVHFSTRMSDWQQAEEGGDAA
jgi:hypothetical protein